MKENGCIEATSCEIEAESISLAGFRLLLDEV